MPVQFLQAFSPATVGTGAGAAALRAGLRLDSILRSDSGGTFLRIQGIRIPLQENHGLQAGQRVHVEVLAADSGLQLRITAAAAPQSASVPTGGGAWAAVLHQLGLTAGAADLAAGIVPPGLRNSDTAARQLLHLFLHQPRLGGEVAQLQTLLQSLPTTGGLSALINNAISALGFFQAQTPGDLGQIVRRMRNEAQLEARLHAALNGTVDLKPGELGQTLRGLIRQLINHGELRAVAKEAGAEKELTALLHNIEERLQGGALQAGRSPGTPYGFIEVPFVPTSGIEHLFLHVLPDQAEDAQPEGASSHSVVMDLALTRLGPLWIELRSVQQHGACTIRCRVPEARQLLAQSHGQLVAALQRHLPHVTVAVADWNEPYLETVSRYLSRLEGVDLHA